MGKQVQVNAGITDLWLYPGGVFDGGDTATLTDAEYTNLGSLQSLVTVTNASVPDPDRETTFTAATSEAALPTADATYRGHLVYVPGDGTTTADVLYVCLMSATGTYSWKQIVTG